LVLGVIMSAHRWELAPNVAKEILPADEYREEFVVQMYTGMFDEGGLPVYLGFGETPTIGKGICLGNQGHTVRVLGAKARLSVNAICAGAVVGGIETYTNIEYRHTPNWPAWITDPQYPKWPDNQGGGEP
jgi:hypothetical protein